MKALLLVLIALGDAGASGPERGTLILAGGGSGRGIFSRFVELAGGKDAKIVIVTTAESSDPDHDYQRPRLLATARRMGVAKATVLHTHDRREAETESFVRPIREARGVWFTGGRQWRLADAYLGTRTEKEFHALLKRGGVVGGSSAGATIQGSFLVRGDTSGNTIMIGDHQRGFGFLRNAAVDQHVVARKRELDLIEVLTDPDKRMLPEIDRGALLGIGIDEGTAIVVRGNRFEVIGSEGGSVLVYDPKSWTPGLPDRKKYVVLKTGARYDLDRRRVLEPSR